MSPHILIDTALDGLAEPCSRPDSDIVVQGLITRFFLEDAITTDEFNHYCKRLMAVQRLKEAA